MAVFQAFRALRPIPEKASSVAALPYDVVTREEAKLIGDKNPDSFLHVDRPEMDLPDETDLYDAKVYDKARENLQNMERNGILKQDETPCYYIYELTRNGRSQTGLVGCCSIDDYMNGVVKKHELTREDKELEEVVRKLPLERILLETDSPYVTPKPKKGRNTPANIPEIADRLADLRKTSVEEIMVVTTENAKRLFGM